MQQGLKEPVHVSSGKNWSRIVFGEYSIKALWVEYDGNSIVTICQSDDVQRFDEALGNINTILQSFHQTKPGSVWGCDGVGYAIEKRRGNAFRKKSGVGPIAFRRGVASLLKVAV